MKRLTALLILCMLLGLDAYAGPPTIINSGSAGILTDSNCDQAKYYPIGTLCQDTDDKKLYKGIGSGVEEIAAASLTAASPAEVAAGTVENKYVNPKELKTVTDGKAPNLLTGYTSGAGTVAATDTILEAIQKLNGNQAAEATYTEPGTNIPLCRTGAGTTGGCTNITDAKDTVKIAVFAWDGGGSAVATANSKRCTVIPYAATVVGAYAIADASTTTHIHVYQDAFATGARATTVTGAVDITATLGSLDTTLTGWDKSITAGDEICMSVETNDADDAKWLNVVVYGTR
jgi:hypothetical protein